MRAPFPTVALALSAMVAVVPGCGASDGKGARPDAGSSASDDSAGSCIFQQSTHQPQPAPHVTSTAKESYNSNPPSSGPHCGTTAFYGNHTTPVDRCNWLHNLEHGAVALLYDCPSGCADLVGQLRGILDAATQDPDCRIPRVLLTPHAGLPTKVAAAAWGRTWTATCIDAAARTSLLQFIHDNLGTRGIAPEAGVCF